MKATIRSPTKWKNGRLSHKERRQRKQKIVALCKKGLYNNEIAKKLGLRVSTVHRYISDFIKEGKIKPRKRGRKTDNAKQTEREHLIIALQAQNYTPVEIALQMQLTVTIVYKLIRLMVKERKITRFTDQRLQKKATYDDLNNDRVQTIITLKKEGASLREIGQRLKKTGERVRQLIQAIIKKHGPEVFIPEEQFWTTAQAARELGRSRVWIITQCKSGGIPHRRRNNQGRRSTLRLDKGGMEALRNRLLVKRICPVCQKEFFVSNPNSSPTSHSDACRAQATRQRRANLLQTTPTLTSLQNWHRPLWEKLQRHSILPNEEWMNLKEASNRSGLSRIQVEWLRHRNVLTTKPHPTQTWRGQPVTTYATSELEIAKQVYIEWQQRKKK